MSIEQYFAKLPKDTPLSLSWKPAYRSCSLSGCLTVVALSPTNGVQIRWYTW